LIANAFSLLEGSSTDIEHLSVSIAHLGFARDGMRHSVSPTLKELLS